MKRVATSPITGRVYFGRINVKTELLRLDALRLELQTQLADYKEACTKAETRAVPASTGMHWTENEPVRLPASRAGRVYMAGPMTGLPELNFPAFNQEAERLRAEGLQVLNPADHGIVDGADWADYLRHDIAGLASCERIHLLRGWTKSKGACLEMTIAKALGMTVTYQFDAEMEHNNAPAVPQGWTDADSDSARLALELECLLMDTKDLSVVSKWWASANEALELHRQRLAATPAPAPAQEPVQCDPFGYFRPEPFGWTDCAKDDEGAVALYERPQESELRKELDSANDFIKSLADLIQKYETMLGYRTTNAPEGAYALAEAKGESSLNTELDLACADFTCQHDFALDPKSSIRICLKCGTPERLSKKTAKPAQEAGLTDHISLLEEVASSLEDYKNDAPWGSWDRERLERLYAIIAALRAKGGK